MRKIQFPLKFNLSRTTLSQFYSIENTFKTLSTKNQFNILKCLKNSNVKPKLSHLAKYALPLAVGTGLGVYAYLTTQEVVSTFDYEKVNDRHYRLSDEVS